MDSDLLLHYVVRHHLQVQPPDLHKPAHTIVKGCRDLGITGPLCEGTKISAILQQTYLY